MSGNPSRKQLLQLNEALRREIEERKRIEGVLRNMLEALPVGVWLLDEKGRVLNGNPAGWKIWGVTGEAGIADLGSFKGWWPDSGRRLRAREWSAARAITKGETVLGQIVDIESLDGQRKTISNSAVPLLDPDGRIWGAIVVVEDISARASFHKALRYSNTLLEFSREELRTLTAHLDQAMEEERRHVAQELHDQLGQSLIASKIALNMLSLEKPEHDSLRQQIGRVINLIDQTIQSVKRIALDLRPFVIDHLGLVAAIESGLHKFEERTGIDCVSYLPQSESIQLEPVMALSLFRIFEEALSNIQKHAAATQVIVRLKFHSGRLLLEVHDNGKGIDEASILAPGSLGITGMRERVNRMGGDVCIEINDYGGTSVIVGVPLSPQDHRLA